MKKVKKENKEVEKEVEEDTIEGPQIQKIPSELSAENIKYTAI